MMKRIDENELWRETETGYFLAIVMLKLLVLSITGVCLWLVYLLIANSNSWTLFVREFPVR